jgi:hypothetical protein
MLPTSCRPFLLHVVANLICILLVSPQPILILALLKFLRSFCGQKKGAPGSSPEKFNRG